MKKSFTIHILIFELCNPGQIDAYAWIEVYP